MTEIALVYFCIGAGIATLMALGAAKMTVSIELMGRPMTPVFPVVCTLVGSLLAWPLVVWLAIAGVRGERKKAGAYSGYESIGIDPKDVAAAAEFDWKQAQNVVKRP